MDETQKEVVDHLKEEEGTKDKKDKSVDAPSKDKMMHGPKNKK